MRQLFNTTPSTDSLIDALHNAHYLGKGKLIDTWEQIQEHFLPNMPVKQKIYLQGYVECLFNNLVDKEGK